MPADAQDQRSGVVDSTIMLVAREDLLVRTFVELADTLVDDFDVIEVTQMLVERCVDLFDAAAGVLLADPDGTLRVLASSTEQLRIVELFEVQAQEGPCLDCYRSGQPVINEDLTMSTGCGRTSRRSRWVAGIARSTPCPSGFAIRSSALSIFFEPAPVASMSSMFAPLKRSQMPPRSPSSSSEPSKRPASLPTSCGRRSTAGS